MQKGGMVAFTEEDLDKIIKESEKVYDKLFPEIEKKIKDKTGQIIEDAQTLREQTNNEEVIDEIDDIAEKAEELREEAEKE